MRWLVRLSRKRKFEAQLDSELRFHIEQRTADLIAQGVEPAEARRRAMLELGGIERAKEECRQARGWSLAENTWRDLCYGVRMLRKSPGFTTVAVLILALGIGANTAIFSMINGVLLQPLEYTHPRRLVAIQELVPQMARKYPMLPVNAESYWAWSRHAKSLSGIAAITSNTLNLTGAGEPARLHADYITANLLAVLGVQPRLGRGFLPDDDQAGHGHEAILTNTLWRTRFHGDPGIIGQSITLNGSPYTVVGVLPPSFHFPAGNELIPLIDLGPQADLFVPLVFEKGQRIAPGGFNYGAIARLSPGVSRSLATAELDLILSRLPNERAVFPQIRALVLPLRDMMVRSSKLALWTLFAAVLAVLLIICVNLANLMLTRTTRRAHEAAIRSALGATGGRMLRQSLAETLLLALLGGGAGLLVAHWALRGLLSIAPSSLPRLHDVRLDGTVLGFTLATSVLAGMLAGLLPAWRMAQSHPQDASRPGAGRAGESGKRLRSRELLVGAETALGVMLVIAAGLLLTSFTKLAHVPKGFAVEHVLTVNLQLPAAEYTQGRRRIQFWRSALTATRELPGVNSSALIDTVPLGGDTNVDPISVPGDNRPIAQQPFANYRRVSPGFFKLLGIPLLRGRELTWADAGKAAVVVSASAAKEVWPGRDPIGRTFTRGGGRVRHVVGVVGDTRSLTLFQPPGPMVYQLYHGSLGASLLVRTRLRPTALAPGLRRAIWKIDPSVPIPRTRSMEQVVSASLAPRRFQMLLISLFALAALLLACLGIYGVVSYSVACRTHEIGIRIALGAPVSDVYRMVLREGLRPVAMGLLVGIVGALALGQAISSLLFDVRPYDPPMLATAVGAVITTAVIACALPARRAAGVDPNVALRHE